MLPTALFKSDEADLDVGMMAEEEEEEAEEEETPTTASDIPLLFMPIETPLPVVVANFGRDLDGVDDGNRLTGGLSVEDDCPEKGDERLTVPCSKSCLKENAGNFDDADDDDEVDDATVTTLDGVVIILSSSSDATDCPK